MMADKEGSLGDKENKSLLQWFFFLPTMFLTVNPSNAFGKQVLKWISQTVISLFG